MSFGNSVGDLLAILKLADDLKKCFSQAPKQLKAISEEYDYKSLQTFQIELNYTDTWNKYRIKRVWVVVHDINDIPADGLNKQQEEDVQIILKGCREILRDLKVKWEKSEVLAYTASGWKNDTSSMQQNHMESSGD
ncbi:hypothetical protein PENCOP_c009G03115 [Penicillium coprophilum]|uniref:Uncharacterized protein n=1 Tax=Penicillium coprophilum TaxID=36646 RepID=A0A1V6UHT1_9EURO|nr:hypothetical protein PENCOP_c009G03115 [Penicillium coprophilum]